MNSRQNLAATWSHPDQLKLATNISYVHTTNVAKKNTCKQTHDSRECKLGDTVVPNLMFTFDYN